MALKIRDGGTLRTITKLKIKQAGVLREIRTLKVMHGGTLRTVATFAGPLSATVSPSQVPGDGRGASNATITTTAATAQPTGGLSPYTYSWALTTNGGGNASTALASSSASTAFRKTGVPAEALYTDRWTVTVTSADGQTATASVDAVFSNISFGGGGF